VLCLVTPGRENAWLRSAAAHNRKQHIEAGATPRDAQDARLPRRPFRLMPPSALSVEQGESFSKKRGIRVACALKTDVAAGHGKGVCHARGNSELFRARCF
jgi:hypothetical protein